MAIWKETYMNLAIAFDATLSDVPEDITHLKEALLALIDLTSIDDGSDLGYGTKATVDLLMEMDLLYRQARSHHAYDSWRNNMVKSINDFTIRYFGDLTIFVNNINWTDGCVPYYWGVLSDNDSGLDISDWNTCNIS